MAQDMFRDVVDPSIKVGGKKGYTVPSSIVIHLLVIALVLVLPLFASDVLPMPPAMLAFVAPPPVPMPPPPPPARVDAARPLARDIDLPAAPVEAPDDITPETDAQLSSRVLSERDVNSAIVSTGIVESLTSPTPLPPPPPPPPQAAERPVRLHSGIQAPVKITDVKPKYPAIAVAARVEGVVILEVTIGSAGRVEDVKVLRSIAVLEQAAIDAVRQWEYSPALLNGAPVPILMTVTVRFAMQ